MNIDFSEADLFQPVKHYLEKNGYIVNGEVHECDLVAQKNDEVVVIELKKSFSLALVFQAVERQKVADAVYVAFAAPLDRDYPKNIKKIMLLLRRLEVGLIVVHLLKHKTRVEIVFHPAPYERQKNKKKRDAVIREASGRVFDENRGGSRSVDSKMTLYRQQAIQIAVYLRFLKKASPSQLIVLGCSKKSNSILTRNFYGWFERQERGVYTLHPEGRKCLKNYQQLNLYYTNEFKEVYKEVKAKQQELKRKVAKKSVKKPVKKTAKKTVKKAAKITEKVKK
ncbi:MAG: DUF2161 family putative PD-(D/E)XK-type phosphodiesterase [Spirochaetes bacterium]|jgi:hypothetical protein|nr:DUF2161 family putative PD-(D/E)XK-type phosphodiesterase [Spirochaetota bacterium]